jgi:hypothetical protein
MYCYFYGSVCLFSAGMTLRIFKFVLILGIPVLYRIEVAAALSSLQ